MNAPIRTMPKSPVARRLLAERKAFPVGSPDYAYRTTAAWKIAQMERGVPVIRWTETPPEDFA